MNVPADEIIREIRIWDVLMGRGKQVHQHHGNLEYRRVVKARCCEYQDRPEHRNDITREIIQSIETLGGRFIRSISLEDGKQIWVRCEPSVVRTKVKQALRDMAKQEAPGITAWKAPAVPKPIEQPQLTSKESLQDSEKIATPNRMAYDRQKTSCNEDLGQKKVRFARKNDFSIAPEPIPMDMAPLDSIETHIIRSRSMNQPALVPFLNDSDSTVTSLGWSTLDSSLYNFNLPSNYHSPGLLGQMLTSGSTLNETATTESLPLVPSRQRPSLPLAFQEHVAPSRGTRMEQRPIATSELMKRYLEQERNPVPGIATGLTASEIAELTAELRQQLPE